MSTSQVIAHYIFAKDHNRPHLMRRAFCEAADLQMVVKSGAISLPPAVSGRDEITDVLVRRFGQTYENAGQAPSSADQRARSAADEHGIGRHVCMVGPSGARQQRRLGDIGRAVVQPRQLADGCA